MSQGICTKWAWFRDFPCMGPRGQQRGMPESALPFLPPLSQSFSSTSWQALPALTWLLKYLSLHKWHNVWNLVRAEFWLTRCCLCLQAHLSTNLRVNKKLSRNFLVSKITYEEHNFVYMTPWYVLKCSHLAGKMRGVTWRWVKSPEQTEEQGGPSVGPSRYLVTEESRAAWHHIITKCVLEPKGRMEQGQGNPWPDDLRTQPEGITGHLKRWLRASRTYTTLMTIPPRSIQSVVFS